MCGIAGLVSNKVNSRTVVRHMCKKMIHRGPDGEDLFFDENTGLTLGHRRLSIVDLSDTGTQPMISHNGRYVIVYNGEIYNSDVLREELLSAGLVTSFRGTSDTEVLLECIAAYGMRNALIKCKGMFAIALFDRENRTLSLARDRVGEKPLYYGHINGDFIFASELNAIKEYPNCRLKLSKKAVDEYLRYSFVPTPLSIYEGIYKLTPGVIRTFAYPYTEYRDEVYYDLKDEYIRGQNNLFKGSYVEAVDELDLVLKAAVKSELMSDVPLGAFLSGGIDSATIVSLMQSISETPVKTFTIGFEEKEYDESEYAADIAGHLGTDHTSLIINERKLENVIPLLPSIYSEPFADSSEIPTYLVSKLARSKVTVSLSGDAGDELFAGYNTYWKVANLYRQIKPVPKIFKKTVGRLGANSKDNTLYRMAHCLLAEDIANLHEAVCYDMTYLAPKHDREDMLLTSSHTPEDEMMLRDMLRYHPDDILVKVDRAGMAVSLENRVPMLDKDVLSFSFSLPLEYKLMTEGDKIISKRILKDVLYRYVPKEMMERPKKGFSVPLERWLSTGEIHKWAWDILTGSRLVRDGILDRSYVDAIIHSFEAKRVNKTLLWNVIVLEQWYRAN